ncbi:glycerate kinase [Dermacoccus sp. Tok2021]|uniref:glycerate kinase n=1 Tax=Dermacoccus sp. Tok2021 TaxID=2826873 RepID=UPI001CA62BD2|nr:glycerate kinase [Dermacoccus sp. Tok2021]MBZ4498441.1 glycerate kinase [Dermacoccus sp. Tok2021]
MKVVCAPDSYKEALSAVDAAAALARGVRGVLPSADVVELPVADGGEGTTETLMAAMGGQLIAVDITDALGRPRTAELGWVASERLAVVDVAQGAGLHHIELELRDPYRSCSSGVGHLVSAALDLDPRRVVIGLGGSATNDGGAGMISALGGRLLDCNLRPVTPTPEGMHDVASLDLSELDPRLAGVEVILASDVTNPLLGPDGATAVFGPQKGVTPARVPVIETVLAGWADVLETATGREVRDLPGAGAAGGLGAAFLALTGATLRPGLDVVAEAVGLEDAVRDADLVLTGEGRIDGQTRFGKTPWGVAEIARRHGVPVVMLGGEVRPEGRALIDDTIVAVEPIHAGYTDLDEALANTGADLEQAAASAVERIR